MKRKLWTLLLALGAALALCVGASAETVENDFYAALQATNGSIKLENDFVYEKAMEVNYDLTIDLNGYVLTIPKSICVNSGGHLTIKDSGSNATHKFKPNGDGLWVLDENGSETVTGGVITGGTGYQYQKVHPNGEGYIDEVGGGVCVKSGGKLTMEGGNIVGCSAMSGKGGGVYVEGDFSMTGGSISGCSAKSGGGVHVGAWNKNATFDMSGNAVIRNCRCKSDSSDAQGGGVYALGRFTMSDNAAIRDCECITNSGSAWGGGVFVSRHDKTIEFTMSGSAVIENCKVTAASPNSRTTSYGGVYVAERSSLTLEDNTKIKDCSAENTSGGATYGGGIFIRGDLTIAGSAEVGENCTAGIGSGIYLEVLRYSSGSWNLYANGGVIAGEVVLNNSSNYGGTIKITGSNEGATEFKGSVLNNNGIIKKGKFTGKVTNNGTISGGEFSGEVTNNKTISGGTFSETVINGEGGTIAEGVSIPNLIFIVTFDNEGTKTTETFAKGGNLTAPTTQTKEGCTLDGWYYTVNNVEKKWNFDTDKVCYTMTLKAKWVPKTYQVTYYAGQYANETFNQTDMKTHGVALVLKGAIFTRSGYTQTGWTTGQVEYALGGMYTNNVEVVLHPVWTAIPTTSGGHSYIVTVRRAEHGTIKVSARAAERGESVTVTATPDSGYVLETISVTDKNGNDLKLTDKGNGKYTFTMPASKVEIKATFMEDNSVLNFFYDVPNDAYYFEAVKWAAENGITGGVGNSLFAPNQPCTRGQIVTFLWRAAGSPVVNYAMNMTDVAEDVYYAEAVRWALSEGITTGTGESSFSPDATCTRAQAVTFLARALNANASGKAEFGDVPTDSYFAEAVAWAAANGVTEGVGGGLFGSNNSCTRGQIVTFLYRAYNK